MITSSPFTVKKQLLRAAQNLRFAAPASSHHVPYPVREWDHLQTETFDSSGVGERDFLTRMVSDPSENVIQISACAFSKDDTCQGLSGRFFRFARPITRLQPGKHLGRIKELLLSFHHAIKHRYNGFTKPTFDHGITCLEGA